MVFLKTKPGIKKNDVFGRNHYKRLDLDKQAAGRPALQFVLLLIKGDKELCLVHGKSSFAQRNDLHKRQMYKSAQVTVHSPWAIIHGP